ncbi:MAG: tetratricopeptide repeat protein, partial [Bacteroidetes bacterium]|nr:tetratricopeptide repeat protein [Bacteroidota bacterium]
ILVTDACHSGKLSGSTPGANLAAEQLRKVQKNEIRMSSCTTDQLSAEDAGWGGGRGVFSYYLVNGLKGLADKGRDGVITVSEIKNFLDSTLSRDPLLISRQQKQTPVVNGENGFRLAVVDQSTLNTLSNNIAAPAPAPVVTGTVLKPIPKQPEAVFYEVMSGYAVEDIVGFGYLDGSKTSELPFDIMARLQLSESERDTITQVSEQLRNKLADNPDAQRKFNNKIAGFLSDRGQELINSYLEGDEAELNRRMYYNSGQNFYDNYVSMFSVALRLASPGTELSKLLQVKQHYFKGLAARLKIPLLGKQDSLIAIDQYEQLQAYKLEENAAYINNELGNVYKLKDNYELAEKYYLRASQISPAWAIPWNNLAGIHMLKGKYDKAREALAEAKKLQPRLQSVYLTEGLINEAQKNYLFAEEMYRRAIEINSRHYFPFDRLGYVYLNSAAYKSADSCFEESEARKKGFRIDEPAEPEPAAKNITMVHTPIFCYLDTSILRENDIISNSYWAMLLSTSGRIEQADKIYRKLLVIDSRSPVNYHVYGTMLYSQNKWQQAEAMFKLAKIYYADPVSFDHYCDSLKKLISTTNETAIRCFYDVFKSKYYARWEDDFFLASIYENWNHFDEAIKLYRNLIKQDPLHLPAYYKLWNLFENTSMFGKAEEVLLQYAAVNVEKGRFELDNFYKRMIGREPGNWNWYYKAGSNLYNIASDSLEGYEYDRMQIKPDAGGIPNFTRKLPVKENFEKKQWDEGLVPGTREMLTKPEELFLPRTEAIACFRKADSLMREPVDIVADMYNKTGDLYMWLGLPGFAESYYKKAVDMMPMYASNRMKLVETAIQSWHFTAALEQLDSLYNRKEINYAQQVMMSDFYARVGKSEKALAILSEAARVYPNQLPEIQELQAKFQLIAGNSTEAISLYKKLLESAPGNKDYAYSIARAYAQSGRKSNALEWLERSLQNGFSYKLVLSYDASWNGIRDGSRFRELMRKYGM